MEALEAAAKALSGVKGNEIKAIAGKLADAEAMVALKVCRQLMDTNLHTQVLACLAMHVYHSNCQ